MNKPISATQEMDVQRAVDLYKKLSPATRSQLMTRLKNRLELERSKSGERRIDTPAAHTAMNLR